jgi:MFS family permease
MTNFQPVTDKTFKCDLWRGFFEGILSTGSQTFVLFIAIRYYNAGDTTKSLIGASPFIGMFCSLLLVHYASRTHMKKATWGALPSAITGVTLILAAWTQSLVMFAILSITAYICRSALLPFLTSIYGDNYPRERRANLFSKPLILTVGTAAAFGFIGAYFLESDIERFSWLFTFLGLCGLLKALAIYSMPSKIIEDGDHSHPLGNLKYMFTDRSFGYVLLTWFIMGFANLWTIPLRVDYLTSAEYGIEGSAIMVALLITIIPDSMRVLFIPFWARLFDKMNFVLLRILLNLMFAIGVGMFFVSKDPVMIGLGSAFIGIAFAGGSIAWSLWVTLYAPKDKVAAYMSVHVFLTGVRGTVGPFIGYWAAGLVGTANVGFLSSAMMIVASIMLIPEIKHGAKFKHQTSN